MLQKEIFQEGPLCRMQRFVPVPTQMEPIVVLIACLSRKSFGNALMSWELGLMESLQQAIGLPASNCT